MADLIFFTGPMDCGKSTLALQLDYTQRAGGRAGLLLTRLDRAGGRRSRPALGSARTPSR